eukprot:TRINITY_DN13790_c0_g1_i2.p1 TRINITY_DN13790_c0_g1~~TRINITY_DN13790_c0_g1_i2.p1  ORF type:complete len:603 (+),score=118.26 TRINITY_DN13790_c0_g1_i2:169-1977(+)
MEADDFDNGFAWDSSSQYQDALANMTSTSRRSRKLRTSTRSMISATGARRGVGGRTSVHTVCTEFDEDDNHGGEPFGGSKRKTVRKVLQDEQTKMEEKRKAYEMKQAQQYMEEVTGGNRWRLGVDSIMEHGAYQGFMTLCTFVSVGLVAKDADDQSAGRPRSEIMNVVDAFLISVFAVDITGKLYVWRCKFVEHRMNIFEAALLMLDLFLQYSPGLPRIASAMKIMRFVRMMRIMRSLSAFRELYLMMMGIAASIRSIVFGAALLFLALTMFGVLAVYFVAPVCHELQAAGAFGDCEDCRTAFDSVMLANLTFFKTIIAGDSWGQLACPLLKTSASAGCVLIGAWMVISLGLLNTIAAVIVDRQALARLQDADYMATMQGEEMSMSLNAMMTLFKEIDEKGDNDSTIDLDELLAHYDTSQYFRTLLNRLDVHRQHLPILFRIMDSDGSDDLTFAEFVHGLHNLKTENAHTIAIFTKYYCETALEKISDIADVKWSVQQMGRRMQKLSGDMEAALGKLGKLADGAEGAEEPPAGSVEEDQSRRRVHFLLTDERLARISQTLESLESLGNLASQLEPYSRLSSRLSLGAIECLIPEPHHQAFRS